VPARGPPAVPRPVTHPPSSRPSTIVNFNTPPSTRFGDDRQDVKRITKSRPLSLPRSPTDAYYPISTPPSPERAKLKFTLPPNSSFTACHKAAVQHRPIAIRHGRYSQPGFSLTTCPPRALPVRRHSYSISCAAATAATDVSAAVLSACDLHSAPASATTDAPCGLSCSALTQCRVEHASCCSESCQGQSQVPCTKMAAASMLNQRATLLLCLSSTRSANGSRGSHAASDRAT